MNMMDNESHEECGLLNGESCSRHVEARRRHSASTGHTCDGGGRLRGDGGVVERGGPGFKKPSGVWPTLSGPVNTESKLRSNPDNPDAYRRVSRFLEITISFSNSKLFNWQKSTGKDDTNGSRAVEIL
ncbi:unnamed protein product [Citrullus colocynthis]|uniref:Uncharacterized protein n=1 Tax=Citrullus colocynthis TaxID=252529 RepID=A0ABP0Y7I4_9ROSI